MFSEKYRKLTELNDEEKSKVDFCRKVDVMEVVKLLGEKSYPSHVIETGKTSKKRIINNPIDYLMYVQGMTFAGAIRFMIDNLSEQRTIKTINDRYRDVNGIPQVIAVKRDLIKKQFQALGNPAVRVTVKKIVDGKEIKAEVDEELKSSDIGFKPFTKTKKKNEEFHNVNQVLNKIPQLNVLNMNGFNIYITPIEYAFCDDFKKFFYVLIDDIREDKNPGILQKMRDRLGEPNLILESSKSNYQAIYMMENNINYEQLTKKQIEEKRKILHAFFRYLNMEFGDKNISGLRHPFRLAGFGNMKPEHGGEFVKLIHANFQAKNSIEASYKAFEAQALDCIAQKEPENAIKTRLCQAQEF